MKNSHDKVIQRKSDYTGRRPIVGKISYAFFRAFCEDKAVNELCKLKCCIYRGECVPYKIQKGYILSIRQYQQGDEAALTRLPQQSS